MASDFSKQIKTAETDEWYTKPQDVELILPYLEKRGYKKILCPFDKEDSAFVKVLNRGYQVTYGHLETGNDFFKRKDLNEFDAVVSNPPFSKRQKILERLFTVGVPFALIMNFNGLFDAQSRWRLFKENDFELLVPKGRMHFCRKDGYENSPNFQSVYVCHGFGDRQIEFIETKKENQIEFVCRIEQS